MNTTRVAALILLAGAVCFYLFWRGPSQASMILTNGVIYTLDDRRPLASACAIAGDRIAAVGSDAEILAAYRSHRVIDLHGRPVYPGFIDSHAHVESLGAALMNLDLTGAGSEEDAAARVAGAVRDTARGGWIRGRGWDQNIWPLKGFPTRGSLDRAAPGIPVFLTRVDGHAVWVSTAALRIAGIDAHTPDPEGGKILRDGAGEPSGVFIDRAVDLIAAAVPPPSIEERQAAVRKAVGVCIAHGLTEVHDMGIDSAGVEIYRNLIREGGFPFRVYAAVLGYPADSWAYYLKRGPVIGEGGGKLTVRAVKFYADGALGSRGAALLAPYADDRGNRGLTLTSRGVLADEARKALAGGFQICTHAIGDRANAFVLDAYAEALGGARRDVRFRVEHAQVLAPSDIPRFHALGVIPVMQATHCTSDMAWAEQRLGPERVRGAYAWRSLIEAGSILPGGSDFPVESPDPLLGFYAAITREDREGNPPGGWMASERMTRMEALLSYTRWGAYAAFQEKEKGSIEPGKWADLTVLTEDIMKIDPPEILKTRVAMTVVAGAVAYELPAGGGGQVP